MARYTIASIIASGLAVTANAQVPVWGQCGGNGWTGGTSCVAGAHCASQNPWYYQCLPGTAPAASPTQTPTSVPASTTASSTTMATQTPSPGKVKYFITFGDSYSQTGFNLSLAKPSPQNPLGNPNLPGWTTSGGLNWAGFLVTQLNASVTYSYNLASGGATTDRTLVQPYQPAVSTFVDQLGQFKDSLATRPPWAPWTADDTLAGVWMGVNDVGNAFWSPGVEELLVRIVGRYFDQLQLLYDAGVRNFVLLGVPPTQKTPAMLANGAESNALLEKAIGLYNDHIASSLVSFKAKNAGVTSWVVDTIAPFNEAINNPTAYGARDATCFSEDGLSCLWFNNYHPGVQIHRLVAQAVAKVVGEPWFTL
ncbi:hypothetical protein RB595_008829 [Gaeumannomyces hyphopodioides]